jgi:flagellum-specific peptidoglycan hydrolase FlgJ
MAVQSKLHQQSNMFTEEHISKRTLKILMLVCLSFILFKQDLSVVFGGGFSSEKSVQSTENQGDKKAKKIKVAKASMTTFATTERKRLSKAEIQNLANQYHNIAFLLDPNLAEREDIPQEVVAAKIKACRDYVAKYAPIAKLEEKKTGVPASITLAQGLLESDAGGSRLTQKAQNHFGIKCFSSHCHKGHCKNFTDDTHKDFFVVYQSAWQSFRAHSDFLKKGSRYQSLFNLPKHDYKAWAKGLRAAGYATDKKYDQKLIQIIEMLSLG